MAMSPPRWHTISTSPHDHERAALEFVRARLPDCDPYLAWANFEFIADDGSVYEVDLLVLTKVGVFLVEIKSWRGELSGDAGTWTRTVEGRRFAEDNPLLLANRKAKKLKSLLQHQHAMKGKPCPWIEALIFLSTPAMPSRLTGNAALRVCFCDPEKGLAPADRPGIVRAMTHRECPGLQSGGQSSVDRPMAQMFARALQQAGIRESRAARRVGDYELETVLFESPTGVYQDWLARRVAHGSTRLMRIYLTSRQATTEDREVVRKAAQRECRLLEQLDHPSILRIEDDTESELGPALRFRYQPEAVRLDLFIEQESERLNAGARVILLRLIAEAVKYAH
ncbi:MAG: nuclease-like protein kinase family protein, partial [Akkermansiaceae bacterium]|nr:nuclease-like protein kinase family protein [Akkermansiaceae bacterium]